MVTSDLQHGPAFKSALSELTVPNQFHHDMLQQQHTTTTSSDSDEQHKQALKGLFLRRNELLLSVKQASKNRTDVKTPPSSPNQNIGNNMFITCESAGSRVFTPPPWRVPKGRGEGGCQCSAGCIGAQALHRRLMNDAAWYREFWEGHQVRGHPSLRRRALAAPGAPAANRTVAFAFWPARTSKAHPACQALVLLGSLRDSRSLNACGTAPVARRRVVGNCTD